MKWAGAPEIADGPVLAEAVFQDEDEDLTGPSREREAAA